MKVRWCVGLVAPVIALALFATVAYAQNQPRPGAASQPGGRAQTTRPPAPAQTPARPVQATQPLLPADAVTAHTIKLKDRELAYTARAGVVPLFDDKGEKTAEVFYVAYTLTGAGDNPASRPITFAFNGGPGSASAYLHLGALGPRVLDFGDGLTPSATSAGRLVDNPDTWLAFTDLVFIDPVGTGYSHAMNSVKDPAKAFWGVRQDLDAFGATVRRVLTTLDRFASPVYLAGESYGGFRAARLAMRLPADQGVAVAGAALISPVLEFSLGGSNDFNPLAWALRLPSYAAVNLETQGKLTPEALVPAERFALGDYAAALIAPMGDARQQAAFYARIAGFTGLPEAVVARWQGRVPAGVFVKEIHHDQGEIASNYDASVTGGDPYPSAPVTRGPDPVSQGIAAPLTSAFVAYARGELKFRTDRRYVLSNNEVERKWEWGQRGPGTTVGASDDLRQSLALNPHLKIMINHGMTDLVTPYMASRYVVDHLPATLTKDRVELRLYRGGHMMYLRPSSRAALSANVETLYQAKTE